MKLNRREILAGAGLLALPTEALARLTTPSDEDIPETTNGLSLPIYGDVTVEGAGVRVQSKHCLPIVRAVANGWLSTHANGRAITAHPHGLISIIDYRGIHERRECQLVIRDKVLGFVEPEPDGNVSVKLTLVKNARIVSPLPYLAKAIADRKADLDSRVT